MQKTKWDNFTDEQLREIFQKSSSYKEIASFLGYKGCSGALSKKIREVGERIGVNVSHFTHGSQGKFKDLTGQTINNGFTVIEKVNGIKPTTWRCKCLYCGKEFTVSIVNINTQKSCGCLSSQQGLKIEDLSNLTYGNFTILEYDAEESKLHKRTFWKCRCNLCNNIKSYEAYRIKNLTPYSCGCQPLNSLGEKRIATLLTENKITYQKEYIFKNCKDKKQPYRFDFAIFENGKIKCLIEYQGKQHYFQNSGWGEDLLDIQFRDNQKSKYCQENNIPLIIIPYTDYDKIDTQYLLNKISEVKNNA